MASIAPGIGYSLVIYHRNIRDSLLIGKEIAIL